jgi:hypothetical protein
MTTYNHPPVESVEQKDGNIIMNYALDNPIKRKVVVPENDVPFAPAFIPPNPTELDQTHRRMTWLHNKNVNVHPRPDSGRLEKKK